jgi:hypothetical protein
MADMMQIISAEKVIEKTILGLGQTAEVGGELSDAFLCELLRRIAGFHCPCSPSTMRMVAMQSLLGLVGENTNIVSRIDYAIEALQAGGDLIEARYVTDSDGRARGTFLYLAPPSFVQYPSGTIRVVGLASEETNPLPTSIRGRIKWEGPARLLEPDANERLAETLKDAGLGEQSFKSWLRLPLATTAHEYRKQIDNALQSATAAGDVDGLRIFDIDSTERYSGGWVAVETHQGRYVCRRPQAYGSDLWGVVLLSEGKPQKLVDFPYLDGNQRGCDEAWRALLALYNEAGKPQQFDVLEGPESSEIAFDFPVPLWVQRRLEVVGARVTHQTRMFCYSISNRAMQAEREFLNSSVWMIQSTR